MEITQEIKTLVDALRPFAREPKDVPKELNVSSPSCGSSRTVFMTEKFVVKFDSHYGDQNSVEALAAPALREDLKESGMDRSYYIPDTELVEGVIVQERLYGELFSEAFPYPEDAISSGHYDAQWALFNEIQEGTGIGDIHGNNIMIMSDGRVGLFDLGFD
jgi:hypothetical protein